jgi:hypothetical protein
MPAPVPPRDAPHARGTLFTGALAAVKDLWGEDGMGALREHLPADTSRELCDQIVLPVGWYPEAHFEQCCDVVWRRLAREDRDAYVTFIQRSVASGWGIVHRALLRLATPQRLARRAPELWRHDHTHGELSIELRESSGTIRIRGYPYPRDSIMHDGQAEALRYILSHARVHDIVAKRHADAGDDFMVTLEWT